jgi:uncharacterized protein (DUF1800 family)
LVRARRGDASEKDEVMAQDPATLAFRFGYGLPMPDGAFDDVGKVLSALAAPDAIVTRHAGLGFEAALPMVSKVQSTRRARKKDASKGQDYRAALAEAQAAAFASAKAGFARALDNPDGFRERLVRFWADHFTTVAKNRQELILPATLIEDAIRPHLAGQFSEMLSAATLHPAMLIYLDQVLSIGPTSKAGARRGRGLNENLARELIELHTLGVGAGYSQDDVRQMAELLTGLTVDPTRGFVFEERRAEPGPEAVLGISYDGTGTEPILQALNDLAMRPETAGHIARKLAVHFVSDTPDDDLVRHIRAAFLKTGGDLAAVYAAMLDHPAAWVPEAAKARQPFDFIVASLRALGVTGDAVTGLGDKEFNRLIARPMEAMGQPLQGPGGPDGWPEEAAAWINPQGLAARINWAMDVPARLLPDLPDPREMAARALGPRAGQQLVMAAERAESVREGVGLVLASAEFNRR